MNTEHKAKGYNASRFEISDLPHTMLRYGKSKIFSPDVLSDTALSVQTLPQNAMPLILHPANALTGEPTAYALSNLSRNARERKNAGSANKSACTINLHVTALQNPRQKSRAILFDKKNIEGGRAL